MSPATPGFLKIDWKLAIVCRVLGHIMTYCRRAVQSLQGDIVTIAIVIPKPIDPFEQVSELPCKERHVEVHV